MKLPAKLAIASLAIVTAASSASAQNATTDPVGFVTVNITAGTGTAKKLTLFSAPLLDVDSSIVGATTGVISAVGNSTLSNSSAGWQAGQLSNPASPTLIQITSGNATGMMFLVSTTSNNTADTLTISAEDITQISSLLTAGVSIGNTYKLFSCDTLSSLFGTPETTGILGGTSASNSDSINIVVNGVSNTYFYHTTLNRWTRVAPGNPSAANVAIRPYYGLQYSRLGATGLSFTTTGSVPVTVRDVGIKNSGLTLLSQYWPADSLIGSLGLQSLPNWTSGASATSADTITLIANGVSNTYFYNGTTWRRSAPGNPDATNTTIPVGTTIYINQKGTEAGYTSLDQNVPYSL
jgi:hypothetical protein